MTPALVVALLLDPQARITRAGNVGDGGTRALYERERRRAALLAPRDLSDER
jgi:hypothetical protein